jgi:DNA-binding response OmpR family regulator
VLFYLLPLRPMAGRDDYVPKPYSPRELLAKIRQYMPK